MQGASASCDAGDGSDPPNPHLSFSSLRRPSVSLELYDRFSQNAINTILPNDLPYDTLDSDMDIDLDNNTEDNVTASNPPVSENCDHPKVLQNSCKNAEISKGDRKRAGCGDGSSEQGPNKRITSGKTQSDAIMRKRLQTLLPTWRAVLLPISNIVIRIGHLLRSMSNRWMMRDPPPFTLCI